MARAVKPKTEAPAQLPAVLPEPDPMERRDIEAASARLKKRSAAVRVKLDGGDGTTSEPLKLGAPHSDTGGWADRLFDTFGTFSDATVNVSLGQLSRLSCAPGCPSRII